MRNHKTILIGSALALMMTGCYYKKPTITASRVADFHITPTYYKDVVQIEVWDAETELLLCQFRDGALETGWSGADLNYGMIPKNMKQYFPVTTTYQPLPVSPLKEGQKIYIWVTFIDDHFMAPGAGELVATFVQESGKLKLINNNDKQISNKVSTMSRRRRSGSSRFYNYDDRNLTLQKINDEVKLSEPPVFFQNNRANQKTIKKLMWMLDEKDHSKAYIKLRLLKNISITWRKTPIDEISVFKDFLDLQWLDLSDQKITDVTPITNLPELFSVKLRGNPLVKFSPLGKVKKLMFLDLSNTGIQNFDFLKTASNLIHLTIQNNKLNDSIDFTPLHKLNITNLDVSFNHLKNGECLRAFSKITNLTITNNPLASLSFVESMPKLRWLSLEVNKKLDLNPLITHFTKQKLKNPMVSLYGNKSLLDSDQLKQLKKVVHVNDQFEFPPSIYKN